MAPQRTCTDRRANIFAAPRRFELRGAARGVTASDHPLSQCGPTTATSELQTARVPSAIRHLWTNSSDMRARHERLGPASLPTAAKSQPRRFDLINLTEDGWAQRFTDVWLQGGAGVTLEMRIFSLSDVMAHLAAAGFANVSVRGDDCPVRGVVWLSPNSTPIVARKPLAGRA